MHRTLLRRLFSVPTSILLQAVPPRMPLHVYDNFMSGTSADFLEGMYCRWQKDPASVDPSWRAIFGTVPTTKRDDPILETPYPITTVVDGPHPVAAVVPRQTLHDSCRLVWLIQGYELRGHILADLDPLKWKESTRVPSLKPDRIPRLDVAAFGFEDSDLDRTFQVGFQDTVGGLLNTATQPMTLRQLQDRLARTYTGRIGWEYCHLPDEGICQWLRERAECPERVKGCAMSEEITVEKQRSILTHLAQATLFENFLDLKYPGQKRFGVDGGESLLVGLHALLERSSDLGCEEVIMGMAHRGRLNVLTTLCGKPLEAVLKEFKGLKPDDFSNHPGQGDVKYHLGMTNQITLANGKSVKVYLSFNPSHLECTNPLVEGLARAAQLFQKDQDVEGKRVLPIEIHGDASLCGQGVTFETMNFSDLNRYGTSGTIHVVVNNQIGYTTEPSSSRSSTHCTDIGRVFGCPVLHVNGDHPEEVYRVFRLAAEYRRRFRKSILIDLVCYRRFGHNESDDPLMTQPRLYQKVAKHPDTLALYSQQLISSGRFTAEEINTVKGQLNNRLKEAFEGADRFNYRDFSILDEKWKNFKTFPQKGTELPTCVPAEELKPVIAALCKVPKGFAVHPTLEKILERRRESLTQDTGIDWGTAEALALGTLLNSGIPVRVSGQDVERGTFSQRHAVLHDQNNDTTYTQLDNISDGQARAVFTNSSLSEFGVCGFEAGYSLYSPRLFCMWEAQFGDFANGATIIFDQFLCSGESKWKHPFSLVVSLPHGYDGAGPEHSSGRIERFLQAVSEDEHMPILDPVQRSMRVNIEVVYPSTPAQYFHLIRRHILRDFRKPLFIFFSKAFLRAPNLSHMESIMKGGFQAVIPDALPTPPADIRRVVFCSGEVYFYLEQFRMQKKITDVALVRVEQLSPFPFTEVSQQLQKYAKAEVVWAQLEPRNMGMFFYVEPRLKKLLNYERPVKYVGRSISSSPATGYKKVHEAEHQAVLTGAFAA